MFQTESSTQFPSSSKSATAALGFAHIDLDRIRRRGVAEVIFGEGKHSYEITKIMYTLYQAHHRALCTRVELKKFEQIQALWVQDYPQLPIIYDTVACTIKVGEDTPIHGDLGEVLVVSAGTSDGSVASEALSVLQFLGQPVHRINDVGVAGLHRLLSHIERLQSASVIIVCAGMEGALASVVAGLVNCPVIAVPTSVGYGANLGGVTTLLAMLNSCAAGVVTVNIDNGFGAAYAATQINRKLIKKIEVT
jgi:pyridinium-3,5-biscarboxylic acid mononucleotide synthase